VSAERRRIAEELNAVVLDELRRLAALAAALRAAVAAGSADAALAELRQTARSVLAAMRRVLTVLRSADADAVVFRDAPPPRWWSRGHRRRRAWSWRSCSRWGSS
jgi:signal transduction histidine kinase